MYIKIRQVPLNTEIIIDLPKMVLVRQLKQHIFNNLNIKIESQILIYKGKQLFDDQKLMDYEVKLNDVILLSQKCESLVKTEPKSILELIPVESKYYSKNDIVDVRCESEGAWYEGVVEEILYKQTRKQGTTDEFTSHKECDLIFRVKGFDNLEWEITGDSIRPRSYYTYKLSELKVGMTVLGNYNIDEPWRRGLWYSIEITKLTKRQVFGTVHIGINKFQLQNCRINFEKELMRIEEKSSLRENDLRKRFHPLRKYPVKCDECGDIKSKNCISCGCSICGSKQKPNKIICCDECNNGFHLYCLSPPLIEVPSDPDWYCPSCKNNENEIIKPGEKVQISARKMKKICYKSRTTKEWGKGMACVGRTKECKIVPKDHFGPIPGVEVGTCWKFRLQASEAGVHRPPVAGIHGKETDGAYSLILSGGYEDDVDDGEEFFYTGSGGQDLKGNRRVGGGGHVSDQRLTRMNKALAMSCNAPFNDQIGAESTNWKDGKPVRVVRNYKLAKHSKYAPKDGNRYDGIYKVVKYFPHKGLSGFIVWRYLLRRDDPSPAPWQNGGQELDMLYPPGYLEAQQSKCEKTSSKRKLDDIRDVVSVKRVKKSFQVADHLMEFIRNDVLNEKLWNECLHCANETEQKFLDKVQDLFICICCQELLKQPITTECKHNICKECLERSFSSEIYTCPYCRFNLTANYKMPLNVHLNDALKALFPFCNNR